VGNAPAPVEFYWLPVLYWHRPVVADPAPLGTREARHGLMVLGAANVSAIGHRAL
jgi:hypothetical protein